MSASKYACDEISEVVVNEEPKRHQDTSVKDHPERRTKPKKHTKLFSFKHRQSNAQYNASARDPTTIRLTEENYYSQQERSTCSGRSRQGRKESKYSQEAVTQPKYVNSPAKPTSRYSGSKLSPEELESKIVDHDTVYEELPYAFNLPGYDWYLCDGEDEIDSGDGHHAYVYKKNLGLKEFSAEPARYTDFHNRYITMMSREECKDKLHYNLHRYAIETVV